MAIRPDWTAGTLTLVAGSKDFTTTGSALETAALQSGDAIFTVSGYVLIIETITGQNSGTLVAECPVAAASSDQPLRIRYQPDGSRVQGAMRMVRELLTSGNLEAFAALVGEEDAVPVFVGPGVIKLVPKSEFGPDDTKGNLAAVAQLDSIQNLTELAALEKENDQFIVIGDDGTLQLKSIKEIADAIDTNATEVGKKYTLPTGGGVNQFINGLGVLAAMNKAAVGLGDVENIAPSGMWAAMGGGENKVQNGFVKLPGGIIIQWLTVQMQGSDSSASVSFPMLFPNDCFSCVATSINPAVPTNTVYSVALDNRNPSGINVRGRYATAAGPGPAGLTVNLIAIGN